MQGNGVVREDAVARRRIFAFQRQAQNELTPVQWLRTALRAPAPHTEAFTLSATSVVFKIASPLCGSNTFSSHLQMLPSSSASCAAAPPGLMKFGSGIPRPCWQSHAASAPLAVPHFLVSSE